MSDRRGLAVRYLPLRARSIRPATAAVVAFRVRRGVAVCLVTCWSDLLALLRSRTVRRTLLAYAVLLLWVIALLAMVRHYSGCVHIGRLARPLRQGPLLGPRTGRRISGPAARPPAGREPRLVAPGRAGGHAVRPVPAHVHILRDADAAPLLPAGARVDPPRSNLPRPRGRPDPLIIAALLAACPLFVQNATYTWTKLPAVFCTVLAVALYLKGIRRDDPTRLALAFMCFAFGCLRPLHGRAVRAVHDAPLPRPRPLAQRPVVAPNSGHRVVRRGVLATWYGWTTVHFGVQANVASNPSVRGFGRMSVEDNVARPAQRRRDDRAARLPRHRHLVPAAEPAGVRARPRVHRVQRQPLRRDWFGRRPLGRRTAVAPLAPLRPVAESHACFAGGAVIAVGMMYVPPAGTCWFTRCRAPSCWRSGCW